MSSAYSALFAALSDCETIEFTNGTGSTLVGGSFHRVGDFRGIVLDDTVDGDTGVLLVEVPAPGINVPKEAPLAIGEGLDVYFDESAGVVTLTATSNTHIGKVVVGHPAASADTVVRVSLTNKTRAVDLT